MSSIHFIVSLLILCNVSQIHGNVVCLPGDVFLPNPLCCTSFYQCANGVPILFQCPSSQEGEPAFVFDPSLNSCVSVIDHPCRITVDTTPTPTQNPTPTATPVVCYPGDDLLPNPFDCSSFYQCANGVPILFDCAPNREGEPPLVFDPILKQCVYDDGTNCRTTASPTGTPTENPTPTQTATPTPTQNPTSAPVVCYPGDDLLPNPFDCSSFYQCANGVPILFDCAPNREGEPPLVFDPILKQCVYDDGTNCRTTASPTGTPTENPTPTQTATPTPTQNPTSAPVVCYPGDDLLPNPFDCSSFYQCANGVPILFDCAPNREGEPPLVFDTILKQCVYDDGTNCRTTASPTGTPTENPTPTQTATPTPTQNPTSAPVVCYPGDDLLPNPFDCSSFYQCANGVPILFDCAPNREGEPPLVFDPILKQCVYDDGTNCRTTASPTGTPTENPTPTQTATPTPTQNPTPTPVVCYPGDDLLPNPFDCSSFYQCANGVPILFDCAPNREGEPPLVFDPILKQCVYDDGTNCRTTASPTGTPTENPTPTQTATPTPTQNPTPTPVVCYPGDDLLPNPFDCSSFYQCANGVPILFDCAPNREGEPPLVFDPILKQCVYDDGTNCRTTASPTGTPTENPTPTQTATPTPTQNPTSAPVVCYPGDDLLPNPFDCSSFYQCANGVPILFDCAPNREGEPPLVFDPILKQCVYDDGTNCRTTASPTGTPTENPTPTQTATPTPTQNPTSAPVVCYPGDDLLPNPFDCSSFYQCANGVPILFDCAPNREGEPPLVFDPILKQCVYDDGTNCRTTASPTGTPTENPTPTQTATPTPTQNPTSAPVVCYPGDDLLPNPFDCSSFYQCANGVPILFDCAPNREGEPPLVFDPILKQCVYDDGTNCRTTASPTGTPTENPTPTQTATPTPTQNPTSAPVVCYPGDDLLPNPFDCSSFYQCANGVPILFDCAPNREGEPPLVFDPILKQCVYDDGTNCRTTASPTGTPTENPTPTQTATPTPTQNPTSAPVVCYPGDDLLPNPFDCSSFYQCANGVPILFDCAPNREGEPPLVFDPILKQCVYDDGTNCRTTASPTGTPTENPTPTQTSTPTPTQNPTPTPVVCYPGDDLLPNPFDCSSFYQCANGVPILFDCAPNREGEPPLVFDPILKQCVYDDGTNCRTTASPTGTPTENPTPTQTATPTPTQNPTSAPVVCYPGDDLLPNPFDCSSFYQCANGVPILFDCAPNREGEPPLVFDPILKQCVYDDGTNCRTTASPTGTPTENPTPTQTATPTPTQNPTSAPVVCYPGDDLLPNPFDCSSFYQCANGVPILFDCAPNREGEPPLVFDPILKQCVYDDGTNCRTTASPTGTPTENPTPTQTATPTPTQNPTSAPVVCYPGDDLLPNPFDCSSFYQCANGVPILFDCAPNREGEPPLVFDTILKQCVYDDGTNCRTTASPTGTPTENPTPTQTATPTPTQNPTSAPVVCYPGDDLLPNPFDCSSFYQCANGVPILFDCAPNREGEPPLVFDPILKQCVYDDGTNCRTTASPTGTPTENPTPTQTATPTPTQNPTSAPVVCYPGDDLLPNPFDCSSFYQCANGVPILFDCAPNREGEPPLVFDPILKQCVYDDGTNCRTTASPTGTPTENPTPTPTQNPTSAPVVCYPGDDLLPNPFDCSSFYQCANGVPILFDCAPNREGEPPLVFDPILKQCVYDDGTNCRTTASPTGTPTENPTPTQTATPTPTQNPTSAPVVCYPGDDLLPNPFDCSSFYQCANGVPILFDCAPNREGEPPLVFDPILKQCVYDDGTNCRTTASPTGTPTENPTPTQTATPTPTQNPTSAPVVCYPGDDLLPNPFDCSSFYQCANGVPILFDCAPNREGEPPLVFDPILKQCVYDDGTNCRTTASPTGTPTENPTPTQTATPTPTQNPTSAPVVCYPGDDLLPNPFDCSSFYQCANGVPILFDCAPNREGEPPLVFDPILKQCVYDDGTNCRTTASPTGTPTENPTPTQTATPTPTQNPTSAPVVCYPGDDLLPNPFDCSSFYQCANGVPILFDCAPNREGEPPLVFDPILKQCVYDDGTNCRTTASPTGTPTENPTPTPTQNPTSAPVVCYPGDDLLPNPFDCSSFYQCANGVPILFDCAANREGEPPLNFDPSLGQCVHPHEYPCQCHKQNDPDSCLNTKLNSTSYCAYCFDCSFSEAGSPACDSYENLLEAGCHHFSYDDVLELKSNSSPCKTVVIPGRLRNISVTFNIDKHPLDLYYLMDVSGSMHDDRDNLVSLSSDLIDILKSLTPDFQIGYGAFIDKPRSPFGNAERNDYSFHNKLPLTNQTDDFKTMVRDTTVPLPDRYDVPESHADALAQVIECEQQIGWRSHTRRVVLLATDATFHIAGDGAAGNIFEPYVDGCYLDANGYYTQQLTMDYPSVQQLATAYSEEQFTTTVIFATDTSTISFYEQVASQFKSAYIAVLKSDSSNILDIVRSEFAKIQSRMEIEKSETSDNVKFRYFSNCSQDGSEVETTFCENLPETGEVTFTVQIDLDKCPDDPNEIGTGFVLNPVGLPTFVTVELVYLC